MKLNTLSVILSVVSVIISTLVILQNYKRNQRIAERYETNQVIDVLSTTKKQEPKDEFLECFYALIESGDMSYKEQVEFCEKEYPQEAVQKGK